MADDDKHAFRVVLIGGYGFFKSRHAHWLKPLSDLFLPLDTAGGAMSVRRPSAFDCAQWTAH